MPRIKPVDRNRNDPETLSLLKSISGESRWNVFEGIANHPPTLRAMDGLRQATDAGLTTFEQEVIAIEIARFSGCGYCFPPHRFVCSEIGIDKADIDALMRGELMTELPEIMLLQQFVRTALAQKGNLGDQALTHFQAYGIGVEKMIVIRCEIALYTLLNYFNRMARTDIEVEVLPFVSAEADWITQPDR